MFFEPDDGLHTTVQRFLADGLQPPKSGFTRTVGTRPRDRNERSRTLFFEKKSPKLKIGKVPSKNGDLHQRRNFGNMSKPSQLLRSRRYLFSSKRLGRGKHKGRQGTFVETGSTFDTCPDCTLSYSCVLVIVT